MIKRGRKYGWNHNPTELAIIDSRMERIFFRQTLVSFAIKIAFVAAALWAVLTFVFGIAVQSGEGMFPRIRDGDIIVYFRIASSLENGDILTLTKNGERYTGRIVAKSGDKVDSSAEGKLVVNGAVQYEEIYYETYMQGSSLTYPYTVPENSFFILGDMRTGAKDSRDIGAVTASDIEGKIIMIIRRRGL